MREDEDYNPLTVLLVVGVMLVVLTLPATLPYILATLGIVGHGFLWVLDCMMGAHILGLQPWASWALLGAGLGASLGLWTVAPALGFKNIRSALGLLPFGLLVVLMVVDMGVSISLADQPSRAAPSIPSLPQINQDAGRLPIQR